jgi:hypothetical protein
LIPIESKQQTNIFNSLWRIATIASRLQRLVDGSYSLSSGAVNPALKIIANALPVGDQLLERLR